MREGGGWEAQLIPCQAHHRSYQATSTEGELKVRKGRDLDGLGRNKCRKIDGLGGKKGPVTCKQLLVDMFVWPCSAPDKQSPLFSY